MCDPSEGLLDLINNFHKYYDEPFADASAIPSMLLAKHTRKHVTVAHYQEMLVMKVFRYNRYDSMNKFSWIFDTPYSIRRFLSLFLKL